LLKLDKDYKELNPYVKKLINQYKLGIPLDKALNTFAGDTDNPMIMGSIATVLEAKKYGASLTDALDQITTSKTMRNVLKFSN
jgi:type II secretory pathway component PulF